MENVYEGYIHGHDCYQGVCFNYFRLVLILMIYRLHISFRSSLVCGNKMILTSLNVNMTYQITIKVKLLRVVPSETQYDDTPTNQHRL